MRDIVSRIYPSEFKRHMRQLLIHNGLDYRAGRFMGIMTASVLALGYFIGFIISEYFGYSALTVFALAFSLLLIGVYVALVLNAEARGRFVEGILPDILKLMASNIRSGLTVERSLTMASRPEFDFFQGEIHRVVGRITSGSTLEDALSELGGRVKSRNFEATIDLIVQGIRSGGNLANSLDRVADVIRDRAFVKKEIHTSVQMYVIFIMFAIVFGAPLLFALSSFLVQVLLGMSENLSGTFATDSADMGAALSSSPLGFGLNSMAISLEFITQYAIISLITTSLLGSIVVGLISSGNWKNGFKYMPFFALISLVLFYGIRYILTNSIGSIF